MVSEERGVYRRRYKKDDKLLPKRDSVFTQHWVYTPDCCQLAADTFLHPIHFHTSSGATLHLPLTNLLSLQKKKKSSFDKLILLQKKSIHSPPPSNPYQTDQV
jgi:hypothetical protein